MIEIALDEQPDNRFLGLERPVFTINAFSGTALDDYRRLARDFVVRYADAPIVIVRSSVEGFSLNMFPWLCLLSHVIPKTGLTAPCLRWPMRPKPLRPINPMLP